MRNLGLYIREQRAGADMSIRELARLAGVSNPYLSQIERGLRKPSAEILGQIATGLRISAEALYVRAGLLEERQGSAVLDSLACDPELTERQKQVMHDIYESFRRENRAHPETGTSAAPTTPTESSATTDISGATDGTAALAVSPEPARRTTDQE
jgi:transcriptional regulator with XRE-family HTH domain